MELSLSLTKQIIQFCPSPIWIFCVQTKKLLEFNDAAKEAFDYSIKEVNDIKSESLYVDKKPFINSNFFTKSKDGSKLNFEVNIHFDDESNQSVVFCKEAEKEEEGLTFGKFSSIAQDIVELGFWEIDLVNNKVFWSDRVYDLHETTKEEHKPTLETGINFYRADFRELVSKKVQHLIDTGEDFMLEAVLITKKQNEKWIRTTGTAEYKNGQVVKIYGSIVDIDELRSSEDRYKSLTNNLPGVAFEYFIYPDGTDGLENVSEGCDLIWGFNEDEVISKLPEIWERTNQGGDADYLKHTITQSAKQMNQWTAVWRYIHPDGSLRTFRGYGYPTKLSNGTVKFSSLIIDATEEIKTKELLQQASHVAKMGSWELDLVENNEGKLYFSDIAKSILDLDVDFIPANLKFGTFASEDKAQEFQSKITDLIKYDRAFDEQILITTNEGNQKWIRVIGRSERAYERCIKIYGSVQDITQTKKLESRVNDILSSITDAFYALDDEQRIIYVNKEATRLLNKPEEELVGNKLWELYPEKIYDKIRENYDHVLKTGEQAKFEFYDRYDRVWYEIYAYKSGIGLSAYYRDISQRKNALKKLEKSVEENNAILESIGDAFFTINRGWKITYWNKQAENFTGYKAEDVVGLDFWELYKDDLNTNFHKQFLKAMQTENNVFFEDYNSERKRWFDLRLYGSKKGISAYISDITIKKKANLLLKESNQLFEKVTQATNDAIWEWDLEQNKVRRSKQFIDKFGENLKPFFFNSKSWRHIVHPERYEELTERANAILEDKTCKRWELDYDLIFDDKELVHVLERGVVERGKGGKPLKLVGAIADITNQKKLEKELLKLNKELKDYSGKLEKSNKELEQFAFVTSHDLQEPLRMISSFLDLLQKKYGDQIDNKGKKYIFYANDAAKRMKNIIVDLLKYSRVTNIDGPREEVDLNQIVEDFQKLRAQRIQEIGASIVSEKLPVLNSYNAILTQIFHALLDNALKYAKEDFPPLVDIFVEEKMNEWLFSIKDNGIGIAPEFYEKIFLLFQRLHHKDMYSGTGIGLTYVKRSVEFLGGKIWLESKEGEGTTFFFTIPKNFE